MSPQIISEVLWRYDPANTGCYVCEDMVDEYGRIALEDLSDKAMRKSYRATYEQSAPSD